jgi:SET domain-containing protein
MKSVDRRKVWANIAGGMETDGDNSCAPGSITATEWVSFAPSTIHGMGGFAQKDIAKGLRVIEYVGERIDKRESNRRCEGNNEFIFTLDELFDLDGNTPGNPARFINHSCVPNCDAEIIDDRIWIVSNRDIKAGEEITFNYGFDLEDYRDYPCHCGSPGCVGYIVAEEFFEHVRNQQELSFQ